MFWNDPKLYSANIPTNYFLPNREIFNYSHPAAMHPWHQFSRFTPYENMLQTQFGVPQTQFGIPQTQFGLPHTQFGYPKFDVPMNYTPFTSYGYWDRPQLPFYKSFGW